MYIIGGLGDQIDQLVWAQISTKLFQITEIGLANFEIYLRLFRTQLAPWLSSQPILWTFMSGGLSLFGVGFYNYFLLQTVIFNFIFSYIYFKRFKNTWPYVLLFNFSAYFWIHFGQHPALSQLWLVPLFFHVFFLLKERNKSVVQTSVILGLLLGFIALISNYIVFFLFIFVAVYTLSKMVLEYYYERKVLIKEHLSSILGVVFAVLMLFSVLYPYFRANYIAAEGDIVGGVGYRQVRNELENFQYFSSRPWYFFTPPSKSPILGSLNEKIVNTFESTGYYLADDYFPAEHPSNYFGVFFLFAITVLFYKRFFVLEKKEKIIVGSLALTAFGLVSLMMPPVFTIKGISLYTPGYLVLKFFSMFRVTARMAIVLHIILLTLLAKLVDIKKLKVPLTLVVLVTLMEVFIPLKIRKYDVPEVYSYLEEYPSQSRFIVYPYSKTTEAFFALPVHKQLQVNTRMVPVQGLNAEKYATGLITDEGLMSAPADLLLLSTESITEEEVHFFETNQNLEESLRLESYIIYAFKK